MARDAGHFLAEPVCAGSVLVATFTVHVAVRDLFLAGLAHFDNLDVEVQVLAGHRVLMKVGNSRCILTSTSLG